MDGYGISYGSWTVEVPPFCIVCSSKTRYLTEDSRALLKYYKTRKSIPYLYSIETYEMLPHGSLSTDESTSCLPL
jgi:hypothetical protein